MYPPPPLILMLVHIPAVLTASCESRVQLPPRVVVSAAHALFRGDLRAPGCRLLSAVAGFVAAVLVAAAAAPFCQVVAVVPAVMGRRFSESN